MQLQDYIAQLLQQHNCVIVPDFGGFVANYKSAVVDEFRKKIYPPSKSVLFNPNLVNNDGLLGNYVAQQKKLDYAAALLFISDGTKSWKKDLAEGKRVELGEIGFLYLKNDQIQFEQSREVNLLLAAYGLKTIDFVDFSIKSEKAVQKPVEVKPAVAEKNSTSEKETPVTEKKEQPVLAIVEEKSTSAEASGGTQKEESKSTLIALNEKEEIAEVKEAHSEEKDPQIVPIKKNRFGTIMRYAAAVAIVPMLFYSYWIPMETDALDTGAVQFSDFNPIHTQVKRTYQSRISEFQAESIPATKTWEEITANINAPVYNFEFSEDFYVTVALEKEALVDIDDNTNVVVNETTEEVDHNEIAQQGNFHIISGCFSVKDNANNLVSDLNANGFNAQILDKKGNLHRVSAGGFSTKEEAKSALDKVKSTGFSGWILKY